LQKENANAAHQNKLLGSENKLLLTEIEQLRQVNRLSTKHLLEIANLEFQSMKTLEDNVRNNLPYEEANVQDDASIPSGDVASLQKSMREMRARYEVSTA
jgi:hypothetical protein